MTKKLSVKKLFAVTLLGLSLIASSSFTAFAETSFTDENGVRYVFETAGTPRLIKVGGADGEPIEQAKYQATLGPGSTRTVTVEEPYELSTTVTTEEITKFMIETGLEASASASYGGLSAKATLKTEISRPAVFQHINYQGYKAYLPEGKIILSDLNRLGVYNDDITGIKVPNGYEVVIYQDDNFQGYSYVLDRDCNTLVDIMMTDSVTWNDQISSIEVRRK